MSILIKHMRRVPLHVIWEITNACNLRCIHCEGSAGRRDPGELSTDEALKLCDALIDEGCRNCNVTGGEPLLRRDWDSICSRLAEGGVKVTLVTNGTCVDEAVIRRALKAGVSSVALSLDGTRATHDRIRPKGAHRKSSFDDVMNAIGLLRPSGLDIAVITHINRWNIDELKDVYALISQKGAALWQVQLGLPLGRLRRIEEPYMISPRQLMPVARLLGSLILEDRRPAIRVTDTIGYYSEWEPVLRRPIRGGLGFWTGCYAGILCAGIESNGNVKGCPSQPPEFIAGNIRDRPFHDLWADEHGFAYNTRWQEEKLTGFCARCPYRRLCRAGCTSLAYSVTGTIYENPYCLHRVSTLGEDGEEKQP
ncbi:MAG: radical SAM protein [Pseudomonadota bacterium]